MNSIVIATLMLCCFKSSSIIARAQADTLENLEIERSSNYYLLNSKRDVIVPNDYVYAAQNFYKYFSTPLTWKEARETCVNDDAHLVILRTSQERGWLVNNMTLSAIQNIWLGVEDILRNGTWITVRDELLGQTGFMPWVLRQPIAVKDAYCAVYTVERVLGMSPRDCSNKYPYFCKIDKLN